MPSNYRARPEDIHYLINCAVEKGMVPPFTVYAAVARVKARNAPDEMEIDYGPEGLQGQPIFMIVDQNNLAMPLWTVEGETPDVRS